MVLLPLLADVVLLEPIPSFINEAIRLSPKWRGITDASKSVTFLQGTLQEYDPRTPLPTTSSPTEASASPSTTSSRPVGKVLNLGRVGYQPPFPSVTKEEGEGFDVIWCQWCLGHLSDTELVTFFKTCREALRPQIDEEDVRTRSLIVVKENVCFDGEDGSSRNEFDERDSSVTRWDYSYVPFCELPLQLMLCRSDQAWKAAFREAGLNLIKQQTQLGLPQGLYIVNMYGRLSSPRHSR